MWPPPEQNKPQWHRKWESSIKAQNKGRFFFHFQMYLYFQKLSTIKVVDKAFQTSLFGFWTSETLFDYFKEFWGKQLRHNITRIKDKISQESKWHLNKLLLVLDINKTVVGKAKHGGDKPALGFSSESTTSHHADLCGGFAAQQQLTSLWSITKLYIVSESSTKP